MVTRKTPQAAVIPPKPRGREEVSAAVLDAARALFASRPYKDVTMRDIAEGARVNLGLLHRHFGSKGVILQAVIQAYATHYREVALESASAPQALMALFADASHAPFLRTLAHLILADLPVHDFIAHDGAFAVLLSDGSSLNTGMTKTKDKNANVLVTFALFMGWSLFENFLVEVSGQRVSHERLREKVFRLGNELLAPGTDEVQATAKRTAKAVRRKTQ